MATGKVKWYDPKKGYGFIQPDDGGKDIFVHVSAVNAAGIQGLAEGERVSYESERAQNGKFSAVNLKSIS